MNGTHRGSQLWGPWAWLCGMLALPPWPRNSTMGEQHSERYIGL